MPFTFRLHDPPCDVAFLSIVDGEALYNADNARTRDVKEATIRQIGWHRVALPQEWFLSEKALATTSRVLEAMQCTVQYLKYRCKNEEKCHLKAAAALQHCEEERAAAFEELIERRETVALYKKKMREMSQSRHRDSAAAAAAATTRTTPRGAPSPLAAAVRADGLQCAFCDNIYPSRHALESHFRKRHKRSSGYAAMAAASAAVSQQQERQEQQQLEHELQQQSQQQQQHLQQEPEAATVLLSHPSGSSLPFMSASPPPPSPPLAVAPSTAVEETRGERALREELSELRLAVAKLLTQQAEFYRGMLPSNMAAVPVTGAAMPTTSAAAVSRMPSAATSTGVLPGFLSAMQSDRKADDEGGNVVLRIPRELLHTSAELQLLQAALKRGEVDSAHLGDKNKKESNEKSRGNDTFNSAGRGTALASSPQMRTPRGGATTTALRPTLDPKSFVRSSASGSVNSGVAGAEARGPSTADSLVEVSPMSPSPPMAQHSYAKTSAVELDASNKTHNKGVAVSAKSTKANAPIGSSGWAIPTEETPSSYHGSAGAPNASVETQGPAKGGKTHVPTSPRSSAHALTAPSELSSVRDNDDDLTASSHDQPPISTSHTPLAGLHQAVRVSADSRQMLAHGPDSDSPMVRLPSSTDAMSRASSEQHSPVVNRYSALVDSEEASQLTSNGPAGCSASASLPPHGPEVRSMIHAQEVQPAPGTAAPKVNPSSALSKQVADVSGLLQKKTYGPVPLGPILRSPSPTDETAATAASLAAVQQQFTAAIQPTGGASRVTRTSGDGAGAYGSYNSHKDGRASADAATGQRRGGDSPDPSASLGPRGPRSPTQTPRRGSTPPTSRVAATAIVPALNLSSVSPHASVDVPQRSASPFVGRSHHRHSHGTAEGHQSATTSAVDAVVHESLKSTSASVVLQASFLPATQVPTQKTIPVVRLVPPALSDSAELAPKQGGDHRHHSDDDDRDSLNGEEGRSVASAPSFTNTDLRSQQRQQRQQQQQQQQPSSRRPPNTLETSDASYSVEAQPYHDSEADGVGSGEEEEEEDAMNAGLYEMFSGNSSGSLEQDIAVDEESAAEEAASDPVMEDVLTDDLVQAAPLFTSAMATYPAPIREIKSDGELAEEEVAGFNDGEEEYDDEAAEQETYRERVDDLAHTNHISNNATTTAAGAAAAVRVAEAQSRRAPAERQDPSGMQDADEGSGEKRAAGGGEQEGSVSGDYSHYSYSYYTDEEEEDDDEEEETTSSQDKNMRDRSSAPISLRTPSVTPPMAVSPTAAAATSTSGPGDSIDFNAVGKARDGAEAAAKSRKKEKKDAARSGVAATAFAGQPEMQGGAHPSAGLSRAYSTELTGSEEVASMPPVHDTSFQSNVSHTVKKAGTVFKSIFGKKKKK